MGEFVVLSEGVGPLVHAFNLDAASVRILVLTSPT
jgi:hypothetical protein